jgi:hypothetical protein
MFRAAECHNFASRESLDQEPTSFLASKNILVLRF